MVKIGIYGIHNTTENKWYIGSSTNIEARLNSHIKSIKERTGVFIGVGKENDFTHVILKELKNSAQLELWENFYIGKYDSIDNGYNRILSSRRPNLSLENRIYNSSEIQIMNDEDLLAYLKLEDKEDIKILRDIVPSIKIGSSFRYDKGTVIGFLLNDSFNKFLCSIGLK